MEGTPSLTRHEFSPEDDPSLQALLINRDKLQDQSM